MVGRVGLWLVALFVVALAIVTYAGSVTSSPPPQPSASARALSASRFFMLLPDGKVEITDAWARRIYRWDGRRWVEVEVTKVPGPALEMR